MIIVYTGTITKIDGETITVELNEKSELVLYEVVKEFGLPKEEYGEIITLDNEQYMKPRRKINTNHVLIIDKYLRKKKVTDLSVGDKISMNMITMIYYGFDSSSIKLIKILDKN